MMLIRKKLTLTEAEKNDLYFGRITSEKQTKTYEKAIKKYADYVNIYQRFATIDHTLWFDTTENAFKFELIIKSIDEKKYNILSTNFDNIFDKFNKNFDILFKDIDKKLDAFFKKTDPVMDEFFEKVDKLFGKSKPKK